ncbi:hypothetical protein [Quadrisphaera sp. INWT6]|uniref:hypothetical protein n=1 Tax=Quadrisphaera sp. INWT6 TaxID=2596917 RepID=UPI001892641F|nr:hypothetical protein [Quadrisphaera sp. INWT6]
MSSPAVRPLTLTTLLVATALACSAVPAAAASSEQEPTPASTSKPASRPAVTPSSTPSSAASVSDRRRDDVDEGGESSGETPQSNDLSDDAREASASAADETRDSGAWLSGASGEGAADGELGAWRGDDVDIVGTWADQGDNQTELYSIAPGGEVADFDGAIDIAPGGLQEGETWAAAAAGAYEDRWRESLTRMADLREGRGTTYVRPFHEFNLSGWDWSVSPGDAEDFKAAWARYRAVQQEVFPEAELVYGVNVTSSGTDLDWRTTWPGEGQADVLGVDTYNGWPTISSAADFKAQLDARGDDGIPIGLDAYAEQAEQWGVPLAVPEWSGRAEMGDEPAYVEGMVDWFAENAGDGPGQLEYEVLFNAPQDDGNFQLFSDDSRLPASGEAYVEATEETAEQRQSAPEEIEAGSARTFDAPEDRPTSTTDPSRPTDSTDSFDSTELRPATRTDADADDGDGSADTSAGAVTREEFNRLAQRLDALLDRLEQG